MLEQSILEKKYVRSDRIWTSALAYRAPLNRIPVLLDTYALTRSQYWSYRKLSSLRDARLAALVRRAARIPFWHAHFAAASYAPESPFDMERFRTIPIVSKTDFWRANKVIGDYIDVAGLQHSFFEQTSGSTGQPFGFYHDRSFELRSYGICERMFRTTAGGTRYPVIAVRAKERAGFALTKYRFFHIKGFSSLAFRFAELAKLIQSYRGDVIIFAFSSWILGIARLARERNETLRLRGILAAGEALPDEHRREIEETLGLPVRMYYAASELGRLAFECEDGHLHLNEEWAHVEIVDERGVPVPDGVEGRIIVSVYDNVVMPFIRYDSGDRGTIGPKTCGCRRGLRTIMLKGRSTHVIRFPDEREVSMLDITTAFNRFAIAIRQFQIVRRDAFAFTIRIIPGREFETKKDAIADYIRRLLHPNATIMWETAEALQEGPNGKALYFIDETKMHV